MSAWIVSIHPWSITAIRWTLYLWWEIKEVIGKRKNFHRSAVRACDFIYVLMLLAKDYNFLVSVLFSHAFAIFSRELLFYPSKKYSFIYTWLFWKFESKNSQEYHHMIWNGTTNLKADYKRKFCLGCKFMQSHIFSLMILLQCVIESAEGSYM